MKLRHALLLVPFLGGVHAQDSKSQEPVMVVDGEAFFTWDEYVNSATFRDRNLRCFTQRVERDANLAPELRGTTADCSGSNTTIKPEYTTAGGKVYFIPVVFHVLSHSNGTGAIPASRIHAQIDILNEDYNALAGTPGAQGEDARIFFYLATEDPNGMPTDGIDRHQNDTWFADGGSYWNTIAWDPFHYLNVYTNNASGALGYTFTPQQGGVVGTPRWDRVVLLYSAVGYNSPIGPPYNKGRTATHEIGHWLGLEHTFEGGCAAGNCNQVGDLICDTNAEQTETYGCPVNQQSCGSVDPVRNYMNYTNDLCMTNFTAEQVNRMRCTITNWRPNIDQPVCAGIGSASVRNAGTNPNVYSATPPRLGVDQIYSVATAPYSAAIIFGYTGSANQLLGGGQTALIDLASSLIFQLGPLAGPNAEATVAIPLEPSYCDLPLYTQALLIGGASPFALTNAVDMTVGTN